MLILAEILHLPSRNFQLQKRVNNAYVCNQEINFEALTEAVCELTEGNLVIALTSDVAQHATETVLSDLIYVTIDQFDAKLQYNTRCTDWSIL